MYWVELRDGGIEKRSYAGTLPDWKCSLHTRVSHVEASRDFHGSDPVSLSI